MKEQKCEFSEYLMSYLYKETVDKTFFEAHLASCQICSHELEEFKLLRSSFSVLREQIYNEFEPITLIQLQRPSLWRRLTGILPIGFRRLAFTCVIFVVLLSGALYFLVNRQELTVSNSDVAIVDEPKQVEEGLVEIEKSAEESRKEKYSTEQSKRSKGKNDFWKKKTPKRLNLPVRLSEQNKFEMTDQIEVDEGIRLLDLFENIGEV